jgi:hypothetical protein
MRLILSLAAGLLFTSSAFAALAPNYQREAELSAIISSDVVRDALGGRVIDSIEFESPDRYDVDADDCKVEVLLVNKPLPDGMVGARQFDVTVEKTDCK